MPDESEVPDGRVSRVDRGMCDILTPTGTIRARWAADVVREARTSTVATPTVGDEVKLQSADDQVWLQRVLPRRNAVARASVSPGSSHQQALAANVDVLAICEPCHPAPAAGRIERLLALAWESGSQPAVLLTKADLSPDIVMAADAVGQVAVGAIVMPVSIPQGTGLDAIRALTAPGQAMALLGPSGAGKSTILNALLGADVMSTSHVRSDGKGRHTTAHRELLAMSDGSFIIDTPGLRSIGLSSIEGLDQAFSDVSELATTCRFNDCAHDSEPGCAVLQAIDDGSLPPRRLDSYRKLLAEAAYHQRRGNARLEAEERARWRSVSRQLKKQSGRNRP
ncbi:MAG: ribosome small subunit-dependent GTPase A [Actinomycetes bacterium]